MKGFFFAKPLEYRMETPAEELVQGQSFQGTLQVVNRGGTEEKPLVLEVGLAYGDLKRIKQNEPDAFNLLERHELAEGLTLAPNEEHKAEWEFALASDCPITSSVGCLFLLYGGNMDEPGRWSRIDLRVDLGPELQTFITTLENHFAFEAKSKHYQEGFTEVRFKPPSTYPTLEELSVLMRVREKEGMTLKFICTLKGLSRSRDRKLTRRKVEVERTLGKKEFLLPGGQPNRPHFRELFGAVLKEVVPTPWRKK